MDAMLPSLEFCAPSVSPLHQPEEDQQILVQEEAQQQQQRMMEIQNPPPLIPIGGMQLPRQLFVIGRIASMFANAKPQGLLQENHVSSTTMSDSSEGDPSPPGPVTPALVMSPEYAHPGFVPQIQSIVSKVNLACTLDLKTVALSLRNAEYSPKRYSAVIVRMREPRTTALIFRSGKLVCMGAKTETDSRAAARKYARMLQKLGLNVRFRNFKIQNMVASCNVRFLIRLEGFALKHAQFCSYEPELFPGLIYRMAKPSANILIFVSGKVVITGVQVREDIYEAFENLLPLLMPFKKK